MNTYNLNHILPRKALLLFFGCYIPLASLTGYLFFMLETKNLIPLIPVLVGIGLGLYFMKFYTEGMKVVELTSQEIRTEKKSIKISDIKHFKLKDDSPEFIYLRIVSTSKDKLSIGTRTSSKEELLRLYKDLKKSIEEHNKVSGNQIYEKKLIYDTPLGKLIGVVIIFFLAFAVYHIIFSKIETRVLGNILVGMGSGIFLLFRIFGKKDSNS